MPETPRPDPVLPASLAAWGAHLGRPVDPVELRARLVTGSLPEAFHRVAAAAPGRVALEIDGEGITHGDLDARAARVGGYLRARGVRTEDRVLLCGASSVGFVVAYLGILRTGAVVVPAGATLTEHELRALVEETEPAAAFAQESALERLRAVAGEAGPLRLTASLEAGAPPTPTEAVEEGQPLEPTPLPGSATAILAHTSGTTGRPRGVPLSHANLLSSIRAAMLAWRWDRGDTLVHALPLTHQHGLGGVHATLLAGSRAVLHSRFEPEVLARSIARNRATVLFAVPAIYERLCAAAIRQADFASLRLAVSGSAPLLPALAGQAEALLRQVPLDRYGTTESGLDVSNPYERTRKRGSVGLPLPGVEMAVVGPDGAPVPAGDDGEIVLRGPQVFSGYLGRDDGAEAFFPGGWFRTGDVGQIDPGDGYLSITGRTKEVIITGGLNVYPREVELALEDHPDVAVAAVVGVPSERWGEEVTAYVVPAPGRSPEPGELIAHARARLAPYKCPKRVLVVQGLPRDAMGKVARATLRDRARQG